MSNKNIVEELKENLSINKVIGTLLLNDRTITWTHKYRCPFHWNWQEKTPSLYASDEKGFFHCFWCKKSWDIFTFVKDYDPQNQLSFYESIEKIIDIFWEDLWKDISLSKMSFWWFNDKDYKYKKKIYEFHEELNEIMVDELFKSENKAILYYLQENRKLDLDLIKKFKIWFSNKNNIEKLISKKLQEEKYKEIKKEDTWFFSINNEKKIPRFLFFDRIMFPIRNNLKKIVWWSGWRIYDDQNPKYINSVNNFIYDKSVNLFNIDKVEFNKTDNLIICEWNIDSTQLYNYGANNAVSLLWTNLTNSQINLFKYKVKSVVLLLDNDEAGWKALFKLTKLLLKEWIIPYMLNISPFKDIDDFLKKHEELKGNILDYIKKNKQDILSDYMIKQYVLNKEKISIENRYNILTTIRDFYSEINDDILRIIYKDELKKYDIEFENLEKEYLELKKEEKNIYNKADKINSEKIIEEKWDKNKNILYIIYLLNNNFLEIDDIQFRDLNLYSELNNNEIFKLYYWNNIEFEKKYKSYILEFRLIKDKKIDKILN